MLIVKKKNLSENLFAHLCLIPTHFDWAVVNIYKTVQNRVEYL